MHTPGERTSDSRENLLESESKTERQCTSRVRVIVGGKINESESKSSYARIHESESESKSSCARIHESKSESHQSVRESESSHESRKTTLESDSSPSPGLEYSK